MESLILLICILLVISYLEYRNDKPSTPPKKTVNITSYRLKSEPKNINTSRVLMSAEDKRKYLHSGKWREKKRLIHQRDRNRCQQCGTTNNLEVHHIFYLSLGDEPLEDLVLVCRKCHQEIHDKYGYDRLGYFPLD